MTVYEINAQTKRIRREYTQRKVPSCQKILSEWDHNIEKGGGRWARPRIRGIILERGRVAKRKFGLTRHTPNKERRKRRRERKLVNWQEDPSP